MVDYDLDSIRLFLHVVGAAVWVGGQIVLAALVPVARAASPDVHRAVTNAFNRVAWPFFGLAVVTGVWNIFVIDVVDVESSYNVALGLKLIAVAISGTAAAIHTNTTSPMIRGVTGGGSLVAGLAAVYLGIVLVVG
ncbi:MAG: hypothetical protein GY713_03190 [Actinomycetia bacterium]|nr:hypothetical protein [Actinomycetes bacterium]